MPYYKRKKFSETFYKNFDLKSSSRQFSVFKEFSIAPIDNEIFETSYLY